MPEHSGPQAQRVWTEPRPKRDARLSTATWRYQITYRTPLKRLPDFVRLLLADEPRPKCCMARVDELVFRSDRLDELLSRHALKVDRAEDVLYHAEGGAAVAEVLEVLLASWADFVFVPSPTPTVIVADHDEFTTVFTRDDRRLQRLRFQLQSGGYEEIEAWKRDLRSLWA